MIKKNNLKKKVFSLRFLVSSNKGFTLIEVVIASGMLVMLVSGIFNLFFKTIYLGIYNEKKVQGYQLAQEGCEAVRNIRDNIWITDPFIFNSDLAWEEFLYQSEGDKQVLKDENGNWVFEIFSDTNKYISLGSRNFERKININQSTEENGEVDVSCSVSWQENNGTKSIEIKTSLSNWKQ